MLGVTLQELWWKGRPVSGTTDFMLASFSRESHSACSCPHFSPVGGDRALTCSILTDPWPEEKPVE